MVYERTDVERTLILRLLARLRSALQFVVYYFALTTFSRHPHKYLSAGVLSAAHDRERRTVILPTDSTITSTNRQYELEEEKPRKFNLAES